MGTTSPFGYEWDFYTDEHGINTGKNLLVRKVQGLTTLPRRGAEDAERGGQMGCSWEHLSRRMLCGGCLL